ncbi:uncharacterized protein LOC108471178 [Gossypium arboreum]|nr:uncharacterized protein LOC108471178 [Gossypium arboreum]
MEKVEYEKIKREFECENEGGKNKVLLTRCSPICLPKLFKDLKDKKIDTILHSIDMGPLLQMKSRSMRREVIIYLIERFDAENCAIKVDSHNITLTVEDVASILGSKDDGIDVSTVLRRNQGHKLSIPKDVRFVKLVQHMTTLEAESAKLKAMVLAFIIGCFLCPSVFPFPARSTRIVCAMKASTVS